MRDGTQSDSSAFLAVFLRFPPRLSPAAAVAVAAAEESVSTGSGTLATMSLRKSNVSLVCTVLLLFSSRH